MPVGDRQKLITGIVASVLGERPQINPTANFNFYGGRTAQRAYLDCFRDLLPQVYKLRPTLRINEFEVKGIYTNNEESCTRIEKLLNSKLKF